MREMFAKEKTNPALRAMRAAAPFRDPSSEFRVPSSEFRVPSSEFRAGRVPSCWGGSWVSIRLRFFFFSGGGVPAGSLVVFLFLFGCSGGFQPGALGGSSDYYGHPDDSDLNIRYWFHFFQDAHLAPSSCENLGFRLPLPMVQRTLQVTKSSCFCNDYLLITSCAHTRPPGPPVGITERVDVEDLLFFAAQLLSYA